MRNFLRKLIKSQQYSSNTHHLFQELKNGDYTIDCGANIGEVTNALAKSGVTVYAFEPNNFAFEKLCERFKENSNVKCIKKAISDKNGELKLYYHINSGDDEVYWSTGSSLLEFKGNVNPTKYEIVQTIDLAEFIFDLKHRIKILKIDIEGAEIEVVNKLIDSGAINLVDMVYVETHDHKIPELKEKTNLLRKRIKKEKLHKKINLNWI